MSARMGVSTTSPLLLRTALRYQRHIARGGALPQQIQAIALLVPNRRRFYSIETSTSTGSSGSNFPPPGFNPEQAKKAPSSKEQRQKEQAAEANEAEHTPSNLPAEGKLKAVDQDGVASVTPVKDSEDASLSKLAADKAAHDKKTEQKKEEKKKEDKKLTIWQKIKKEVAHYWDGTKLLATEVKISSRLALKMAAGYELTRRENRQLQRTVQDLGRLVPFSVFVIVPFAELLLPVALRLFPNMLPSTYEGQKSKDAKATKVRATRKEVSSFLRQTLKETGLPVSAANAQREEFVEFFRKVRTTGEAPSAAEVIKVCKIFKDDLTLDNLSRPQLVGITRYMGLNTFGTDAILRYQIRHQMRQIKQDDKAISYEGVESLSVPELQTACQSRGLRTFGMSPARLRDDLQMWLDLRLRYGVPSTLLVLSNAFVYAQGKDSELSSQIDALQSVLASVPEELFHEIELEVHNAEGAATNKQRLEVLKEQQELIEEENEARESSGAQAAPADTENIDEKEDHASASSDNASTAEDSVADNSQKEIKAGESDGQKNGKSS